MGFIKKNKEILIPIVSSIIALTGAVFTAWYIGSKAFDASIIVAEKSNMANLEAARLNNIALLKSTNESNKSLLDSTHLMIRNNTKLNQQILTSTLSQIKLKNELDAQLAADNSSAVFHRKKRNSVMFLNSYIGTLTNIFESQLAVINKLRSTELIKETGSLANKALMSEADMGILEAIHWLIPVIEMDTIYPHTKYITTDNAMKIVTFFLLTKMISDVLEKDINDIENNFPFDNIIESLTSIPFDRDEAERRILIKRQATQLKINQLASMFNGLVQLGTITSIELNKYLGRNNNELQKKLKRFSNDDYNYVDDYKKMMNSLQKEMEKILPHK